MYSLDISTMINCTMFGRMKQTNGWEYDGIKTLKVNLFVFMLSGSATFTINNKPHNVSAGDILIIPKNSVYKGRTDDFCEYFFFHFSGEPVKVDAPVSIPALNSTFSFLLTEPEHHYVYFEQITRNKTAFDKIYSCIINCVEYQSRKTHASRLLIDVEFSKIMLILCESLEKTHDTIPPIIEKMCAYIRKNITKNLTLSEISSECSVSTPYACRIFKKHTNMTIKEYINNTKLLYALELIQCTSMNISEISDYLGYCDVFYFSKLFKNKFGKSPKQFLK